MSMVGTCAFPPLDQPLKHNYGMRRQVLRIILKSDSYQRSVIQIDCHHEACMSLDGESVSSDSSKLGPPCTVESVLNAISYWIQRMDGISDDSLRNLEGKEIVTSSGYHLRCYSVSVGGN
jgi:hypothetical protein